MPLIPVAQAAVADPGLNKGHVEADGTVCIRAMDVPLATAD